MSGYIKRNKWIAAALFWALAVAVSAQAASFDCAKAESKVEHIICDIPEISKLDDDLSAAYKTAVQDKQQADAIRQAQKQWMKERNACADVQCVKQAYQSRIGKLTNEMRHLGKERYSLAMSKDDEMCHHMLQLMNDDLKKFERTYDSNDRFASSHEEFNAVPWEPARASYVSDGQVHYWNVEGALFDLNNDGALDFVVRDKSMLSGMRVDRLYMLDSSAADHMNALSNKELFESKNQISMDQVIYMLSPPLEGHAADLWLLSPFIYHGVSYIYMQSLYKNDEAIGGDFVVIAKYIGGKFERKATGKMEDICYIERVDVK